MNKFHFNLKLIRPAAEKIAISDCLNQLQAFFCKQIEGFIDCRVFSVREKYFLLFLEDIEFIYLFEIQVEINVIKFSQNY